MPSVTPIPFLRPLFESIVRPSITCGFHYLPEDIALHGIRRHGAVDFTVPRGTKILAPADGYYLATYGEVLTTIDGRPRRLSYQEALRYGAAGAQINPPGTKGSWPVYYGSYVIQGWHEHGYYTQYAHVDWVNPDIPYHPPIEQLDDAKNKTGNLLHSSVLRAYVNDYKSSEVATFIRAGEVIGEVGMTGCGWNRRCYDFARFDDGGRPDFRGVRYFHYAQPHLHFAVLGRRHPRTRNAKLIDPFGIYGQITAGYPAEVSQWSMRMPRALHNPLWLPAMN